MYEINQEAFLRQARQDHTRLLDLSEKTRLIASVQAYTPKTWDVITLHLGNWLINLGKQVKARSIYTELSKKHA